MEKPQLFLLHFAGGNTYSFQFMIPLLNEFDVVPLELPGRGKRIKEDLLKDFDSAATDLYNQVLKGLKSHKFLIYGHSMGACLALRVSSMLERSNKFPIHIIVSGNAGPGVKNDKIRYLLKRDDFIKELETLGGVPTELIENEELFNFFEPILRADFELLETTELLNEPVINTPIYAIMGNKELKVKEISNWAKFTKSHFNCEIMDGDHFFIQHHPEKIVQIIKNCYDYTALL